jgi:hypothetical protein
MSGRRRDVDLIRLVLWSFVIVTATPVVVALVLKLVCGAGSALERGLSSAFERSREASSASVLKINAASGLVTIAGTRRSRRRTKARERTMGYLREPTHESAVFGVVWEHPPEPWPAPWAGPHSAIPYN